MPSRRRGQGEEDRAEAWKDRDELKAHQVRGNHLQDGDGSGKQDRAGRTVPGRAGRARSGAVRAASGIVAFPELRVSKRDKQGTVGFVSTRPTQLQ